MMGHPHQRATAGFSLVELLVALTLMVMTLGAVVMVSNAHGRAYQAEVTAAHLDAQLDIAVERVVGELRIAEREDMTGPAMGLGSSWVEYTQATDYVAEQVVSTPLRRIEFDYELGELDDGLDNNGNGLVDEGRVVLTEDLGGPNERRLVVTRWVSEFAAGEVPNGLDDNGNGMVDEQGFWVETAGGAERTLIVLLSLQRRDTAGRLTVRTSQTSIRVRN